MPGPKINGNGAVIQKPYEIIFDPRMGETVRYRYRSAGGPYPLLGTYANARASGWRGRMLVSPVMSELEIESPEPAAGQGEVVTDTWQVVGSEASRSVFENRIVANTISANDRTLIAYAVAKNLPFDDAIEAAKNDGLGTLAKPSSAAAKRLYEECLNNQDSFAVAQYVLRHTTNCYGGSTNNIADFNVECLYTTAQLLSEAQNGNLWAQTIPLRLKTKILAIPSPTVPGDLSPYYLWSWRKLPSTETATVNNRIEINTEYVLDLWSTLRYALAT